MCQGGLPLQTISACNGTLFENVVKRAAFAGCLCM
jgi:hypothetical protein